MPGQAKINITEKKRVGLPADAFNSLGNKIIKELYPDLLDPGDMEISLVFVSDSEIQKLNAKYRGKDQPTDVLSYSYLEDLGEEQEDRELGEVIISVDTLKRQANEYKHTLLQEAKVLFVHGLLHLLGYDHENIDDENAMKKLESEYLGDKSGLVGRGGLE